MLRSVSLLRKVIVAIGLGLVFVSVSPVAKAEWIKDQQNKWVYYENASNELVYVASENFVAPIELPQYLQEHLV